MLSLRLRGGPSAVPAPPGPRGPFRLLVAVFLRRFLENDLLAGDGDTRVNFGVLVALLAAPGAFSLTWLTLAYAGPFLTPSERLVMALDHKYQFIAASMTLAGLAAALEWDALSLDARDLAVLGPLPIPPSRLLGAKIAALALFVLSLAAAVNLVPTLGFPVVWLSLVPIGPLQGAWITLVHGVISLAAAATGFLAVLAARSLVALACHPRLFRAASTAMQFALVLAFATLFLLAPMIPADVRAEVEHPTSATLRNPAMWLLGAYEGLTARALYANPRFTGPATWQFWEQQQLRRERNLGPEVWAHPLPLFRTEAAARRRYQAMLPTLDRLAARGGATLPVAAAATAALYLFADRQRRGRQREASAPGSRTRSRPLMAVRRALEACAAPRPLQRAAFAFTLQALFRSGPQRLHFAGALAFGFALALFAAAQATGPALSLAAPSWSFLCLEYAVVFFLLVALRRTFEIPAAREASWIFRLTLERADSRHVLSGVRRAIVAAVVLPCFAVLAILHGAVWGGRAAAAHLALAVPLSLVLVEFLLLTFRRIPFTCAYIPADSRVQWPFQAAGLLAGAAASAALERLALGGPRPFALVTAAALCAVAGVRRAERREPAARQLTFDDQPEQALQRLGL